MDATPAAQQRLKIDSRLLTAAGVLVGVGATVWFAGMVVGSAALASAARQWMAQLEEPPSALARAKWQQLLAATNAGAAAWSKGIGSPTAS